MALKASVADIKIPSAYDWRTTDADEINRRRFRARDEVFNITNLDPQHPIFSNFRVKSASGLTYSVEVRDIRQRHFACDCVDFRTNGLGTCKHAEAVLLHLEGRFKRLFRTAREGGSTRLDIVIDPELDTLRLANTNGHGIPAGLRKWFRSDGALSNGSPEIALSAVQALREDGIPELRVSQEVGAWLENRLRAIERKELRREYELKVQSGEWPPQETKVPLFPYQREGMLHLAFTERALLADEMGLGKTIQAIAACALLHRLGKARHVLVVTPASLKTEWEEQIQRFTDLDYQLVFGPRGARLAAYTSANAFFTIVNYEQMVTDALDVNARLRPDIVVLDEAQRIKNWSTKTAQAVKRLRSRYAFVLTGTPIENRIDELHSLMDFLNPSVLGPLFRFNRDFYELNERGRPEGYRNLDQLHERIRPHMLRRRKADVETELPERTDQTHFVPLSPSQQETYAEHERVAAKLLSIAKRRPLTQQEQESLQRRLAMMRMVCDTNYIMDRSDRACPKLAELEKVLDECGENDAKVIVFSEWEGMLELVRNLCRQMKIGFAWHTGSVPQLRRRSEINMFKTDPNCRVFLSTDSGATGLNLQNASVVINCDLPWNPAKLEQRIARAWRKNQTKPVTVINLVSENTIEHRMLETLAGKQALADGVLDLRGDLKSIPLRRGGQAFLARLQQLIMTGSDANGLPPTAPPAQDTRKVSSDKGFAFAERVRETINGALVRCEERYPNCGAHSVLVVVVENDPARHRPRLESVHGELFGPGKSDPLAPVHLEVIDRATDEALQRLIAAGLIQPTMRSQRPLFSATESIQAPAPLTAEERAKADAHRSQAARKLKMAELLGTGGLADETRTPMLEAILGIGRALAVEGRLPEPDDVGRALIAPLAQNWGDVVISLRAFVSDPSASWESAAEALKTVQAVR